MSKNIPEDIASKSYIDITIDVLNKANIKIVMNRAISYNEGNQIYKTLLNREKRGQTSHLYSQDVKQISIPVPPIEKQNIIAYKIVTFDKQMPEFKNKLFK